MPGWILIIGYLIKYGPAIVNMVQEILAMLKKLRGRDGEPELKAEFDGAVKHFRATGDKGPLRRLREKLHTRCYGAN